MWEMAETRTGKQGAEVMTIPTPTVPLDEVLINAVLMHSKEFGASKGTLLHIEYHRLPLNKGLEYLKVWSSTVYGTWDLVCQYWMIGDHRGRPEGITFHPPFYSANLGQVFGAIMQNQSCFVDFAVPTRDGMIQVSAPTKEGSQAARASMQKVFNDCNIHSPVTSFAGSTE
jgi:hypothetical protein